MKKTLCTLVTLGVFFSGTFAFAKSNNDNDDIPFTPIITTVSPVAEHEETSLLLKSFRTKMRGDVLIKERINSLTANLKVITEDKKLTLEQKSALSTLITTNITGLTALRASLASSTDATSTKALIASIFTNFRIYGIVIPQIRIEKRIYELQNHTTKLSDTFLSIQKKIDEAKTKGKDVVLWQKSLDDAKVLVANDMNALATLMTKVALLKPVDYGTTSKAVIEEANRVIKSVLVDFNSIKKNIHRSSNMSSASSTKKMHDEDEVGHTSPLSGTSWIWSSSVSNGAAAQAPVGGKFILSFNDEGRVRSTTDCNSIGGRYTIGINNSLSFGSFVSTMMFCQGSQELQYSQALSKTQTYAINGSTITLTNASGTMIFMKK